MEKVMPGSLVDHSAPPPTICRLPVLLLKPLSLVAVCVGWDWQCQRTEGLLGAYLEQRADIPRSRAPSKSERLPSYLLVSGVDISA